MKATRNVTLALLAVLLFGAYSAAFMVNQTQQALVLQFGEPKRTIQEPGLKFKLPFIQEAVYYERRVLSLIPQDAEEVILADQKRLQVDAYARYRIEDPLLFFQTVRNEIGARARLESIIDSSVRRVLGRETLASILTGERESINGSIRDEVNQSVASLGIQIIDVRLRRADYPEATSQNIFNRMKSEREREAKEFRATGEEEAQKIKDEIKEGMMQAAQAAGAGNTPGEIQRMIKELTEPKMNWREILQQQIQSTIRNDFTFQRPNRKSWHTGAILPGMDFDETIDICVAVDMSGSIGNVQAQDFLSEIQGIIAHEIGHLVLNHHNSRSINTRSL